LRDPVKAEIARKKQRNKELQHQLQGLQKQLQEARSRSAASSKPPVSKPQPEPVSKPSPKPEPEVEAVVKNLMRKHADYMIKASDARLQALNSKQKVEELAAEIQAKNRVSAIKYDVELAQRYYMMHNQKICSLRSLI
jgi:hypothetical protein